MRCACHADRFAPRRAGASNGCPFISPSLAKMLKDNRASFEVLAGAMVTLGTGLTSSIVLANIGVPIAAGGAALLVVANGCDSVETMKAAARTAARGLHLMSLLVGIAVVLLGVPAIVTALTGAGVLIAIAEVPLSVLGIACEATALLCDALSVGQSPSQSVTLGFVAAVLALGGVDISPSLKVLDELAKSSASFQDAALKNQRKPMRPIGDDVNLELFARGLLTLARDGASKTTLDRYFIGQRNAAAAPNGFAPSSMPVLGLIESVWGAWRKAGYPTTTAPILSVLRVYLGRKQFFKMLEAAFSSSGRGGTVIPKAPITSVADRITGPGPRGTAPPPDDEGGGIGLLIGAGLVLKFLL